MLYTGNAGETSVLESCAGNAFRRHPVTDGRRGAGPGELDKCAAQNAHRYLQIMQIICAAFCLVACGSRVRNAFGAERASWHRATFVFLLVRQILAVRCCSRRVQFGLHRWQNG